MGRQRVHQRMATEMLQRAAAPQKATEPMLQIVDDHG
jgi:hypothetical protein